MYYIHHLTWDRTALKKIDQVSLVLGWFVGWVFYWLRSFLLLYRRGDWIDHIAKYILKGIIVTWDRVVVVVVCGWVCGCVCASVCVPVCVRLQHDEACCPQAVPYPPPPDTGPGRCGAVGWAPHTASPRARRPAGTASLTGWPRWNTCNKPSLPASRSGAGVRYTLDFNVLSTGSERQ